MHCRTLPRGRHSSGCVRNACVGRNFGVVFFHRVLSLLYAWLAQGCCPVFRAFNYNRYSKAEQNVLYLVKECSLEGFFFPCITFP